MKTKFRPLTIAALLLICCKLNAQIKIEPGFWGQNLWFSDYSDAPISVGTGISSLEWSRLRECGAKMLRVGGKNYNNHDNLSVYAAPTHSATGDIIPSGYVSIVDDIRSNGFEPMITVPFRDDQKRSIAQQAAEAGEIVRVLNVVHKRNVKYFIIGNEPGKDQGYYPPSGLGVNDDDVRRIRDYIKAFAVAMKKVDPEIKIIGPELEWHVPYILTRLFDNPTSGTFSIKGQIGTSFQGEVLSGPITSKYFVDFLSFHAYGGTIGTYASNIRHGYIEEGYVYKTEFNNIYSNYISNAGYNRTGNLKVMVDEFNMDGGSVSTNTDVTSETKNANTFLAGQLIVDMMAGMLGAVDASGDPVYEGCNLWSLQEGDQFGFLHGGSTSERKPTYWHYYMMANYFKGKFYPNNATVSSYPKKCLRAYACKSKDFVVVLAMNGMQSSTSTYTQTYNSIGTHTFAINFSNQNTSTAEASFNMSLWGATNYTFNIDNKSSSLLFFNCTGGTPILTGRLDLKENDIASLSSYTLTDGTHQTGTIPSPALLAINVPTTPVNCAGGTSALTLTAPSGASNYTWYAVPSMSIVSTSNTFANAHAGIFQLKMTGGCDETWLAASVHETSPIIKSDKQVIQYCTSGSATMEVAPTSGPSYLWSPSGSTSYSASVNPATTTIYTVNSTQGGCTTSNQITVIPTDPITTPSNTPHDLWIKDDAVNDLGAEPNVQTNTVTTGVFWASPDIWITHLPASVTGTTSSTYTTHLNGEFKANGDPNYVHVRVRNSGTVTATGEVKLYWAKASTGLAWATPSSTYTNWENFTAPGSAISTTYTSVSYGDQIGTAKTVAVVAGSFTDVEFPWYPSDPALLTSFWDHNHFCLLARVESGCGMTSAEVPSTWTNAYENNNIAWKNVTVYDNIPNDINPPEPEGDIAGVLVNNPKTITTKTKLKLVAYANPNGKTIFDVANPYIHLDPDLYDLWVAGGSAGTNIADMGNDVIKVTGNNATLENIDLASHQSFLAGLRYTFNKQVSDSFNFEADLIQYKQGSGVPDVIFGGERYVIVPPVCPTVRTEFPLIVYASGCGVDLKVLYPQTNAGYTWYNRFGEVVGTGTIVTVFPTTNMRYYLHGAMNGCVMIDSTIVRYVNDSCGGARMAQEPPVLEETKVIYNLNVIPNPATDHATVVYSLNETEKGELVITNTRGQVIAKQFLNRKENKIDVDCNKLSDGLYYISLIIDEKNVKTIKLAVIK